MDGFPFYRPGAHAKYGTGRQGPGSCLPLPGPVSAPLPLGGGDAMSFKERRECPRCEAVTVFTDPKDLEKWKDVHGCPACMKHASAEPEEEDSEPMSGGIQMSLNGVPVKILRWETVLTHVIGPGGVPVAFDTGRRLVEIELPAGEPP